MDSDRESGYLLVGGGMLKLIRDWLEKFSVGSLLVAVYQSTTDFEKGLLAAMLGIATFSAALVLAKRGVK